MEEILFSTLRLATPLIFACMAGLLSERSGVIQIGLEGFMLVGALSGAITTFLFQSSTLGLMCSGISGLMVALLFSLFTLRLRADQIVVGTAFNLLAVGLCPLITKIIFDSTGSTPSLGLELRMGWGMLALALVVVVLTLWLVNFSRFGLYLRMAGENPSALRSLGTSVTRVRLMSLGFAGIFAAWGGASLSMSLASAYSPNMTAGRGFMALAALIFGRWQPLPALGACLLFGFVDALQIRIQGSQTGIPVALIQILPYVVTMIALIGFFGQSRIPKGLGRHP